MTNYLKTFKFEMVKHPLLLVEHFVKLLGMHHGPRATAVLKLSLQVSL